jgi:FkbM family methyltransferase
MTRSPGKLWWIYACFCQRFLRYDPVSGARIHPVPLQRVGSGPGAWKVPQVVLRPGAVVYAAGLGLDSSFDEACVREHNAVVHAFDPTPAAIAHAATVSARCPGFHFEPVGVWNSDTEQLFHAPANPGHVSHSLTALQGERPAFRAPCKRLSTLARERAHARIDLLKLDIEGAEYAVLQDLLAQGPPVTALCVEFDETHTPQDPQWRERIAAALRSLSQAGFRLVGVAPKGNYSFLRSSP